MDRGEYAGPDLTAEMVVDGLVPSSPAVSPDGRQVAYVVTPVGRSGEYPVSALWTAASDRATPPRRLTAGTAHVSRPRWTSDSILFLSAERGVAQLHRVRPGGWRTEVLTSWNGGIADHLPLADPDTVAFVAPDEPTDDDARRQRERDDARVWGDHAGRHPRSRADGTGRPNRLRLLDLRTGRVTTPAAHAPARRRGGPATGRRADRAAHLAGARAVPGPARRRTARVGSGERHDPGPGPGRRRGVVARLVEGRRRLAPGLPGGDTARGGRRPRGARRARSRCARAGGPAAQPHRRGGRVPRRPRAGRRRGAPGRARRRPGHRGLPAGDDRADRVRRAVPRGRSRRVAERERRRRGRGRRGQHRLRAAERPRATAWRGAGPPQRHPPRTPRGPLGRPGTPVLPRVRRARSRRPARPAGRPLPHRRAVPAGDTGARRALRPARGRVHARLVPVRRWLATAGYAVFLPNPRGGKGHGHEFAALVAGAVGGDEFGDVLTGIDLLVAEGVADPDRLGIAGWSHGGFLAAWAVSRTDRFRAGLMGAGISDWGMLVSTGEYGTLEAALCGGTDWEGVGPRRHDRVSPISFASGVRTPVLIVHGEDDTNVPVSQAEAFHRALCDFGAEHAYGVYPREGHAIRERNHQRDLLRHTREWFDRWLVPDRGRPDPAAP